MVRTIKFDICCQESNIVENEVRVSSGKVINRSDKGNSGLVKSIFRISLPTEKYHFAADW